MLAVLTSFALTAAGTASPFSAEEQSGPPQNAQAEAAMAGTGSTLNREGALRVVDNSVTYADGHEELQDSVGETETGGVSVEGIKLQSDDYSFTGISSEESDTVIKDARIELNVSDEEDDFAGAGTAVYADSGKVSISDSDITVNGAGRYTIAAEGSASLVVNNSIIHAGGDNGAEGNTSTVSEPASNAGLLISGTSRAAFAAGETHTWLYHSLCLADGWAALSTDSATGSGLELTAYDTDAIALNGGYGLYADTNCRDYIYASNLISAEVGAIISNNGSVTIGSAYDAVEAVTQDGNEILSGMETEPLEDDIPSTIAAGRNAVMIHSPDMMGEGNKDYTAQLFISNTDMITEETIRTDSLEYVSEINNEVYMVHGSCDYTQKYGEAIGAYENYIAGAGLLIKSTSADIELKNVGIDSYNGIAVLSALNSDSMSRYLKTDCGNGVNINVEGSWLNGSIVHDDYQRDMNITVSASELNGSVVYADANQWNKYWSGYADDEAAVWYGLPTETYVTNLHETNLSLLDGSVWNAEGTSRLTTLTVSPDSEIIGTVEADEQEETEEGLIIYKNAVVTGDVPGRIETPSLLEPEEADILIDTSIKKEASAKENSSEGQAPEGQPSEEGPGGEMPGGQPPEGGPGGEMSGGQPPEGGPGGEMPGGQPPEEGPGGERPEGQPPEGGPGGEMPEGGPGGEAPHGMPGEDGSSSANENVLGSWTSGGTDAESASGDDYAYDSTLYITAEGIDEEKSAEERIASGEYDAAGATDITLMDVESGHNGILIYNTPYTITNSLIEMVTEADGTDTCDFSGKGSAVAVFGSDGKVNIEDSVLRTAGVAAMPLFADSGATVTVNRSELISDGGTLHADYMNTPDQGLMVAPPWILGIMGTSRASNMMGTGTTTNVIDSAASAGAWAVLSTDAGEDMTLNVYNTSMTLTGKNESERPLQAEGGEISETRDNPYTENFGTGYGTYVIGNAAETFAGSIFNVGTYATIFTGGSATYTNLETGKTYALKNSVGETTAEYTAAEDKVTEIHSDTFGFMAHQGTNNITIENGTTVDSGYATFLVKTGSSNETLNATVDGAFITNGGVLIQVMDNDDTTNGGMLQPDDEANTNGGSQNFIPWHTEDEGFCMEQASAGNTVQSFSFTNGEYNGNIYNASGSDGLEGSELQVVLGEQAVLNGAAASTSAVHVTYDGAKAVKEAGGFAFTEEQEAADFASEYQNTHFTIDEYYSIGQVANLIFDNGANHISMKLSGDAEWNVTGDSLIEELDVQDSARVVVAEGVTLRVGDKEYTDCVIEAE